MKKSISMSIRVIEEELDKFKQAARLEAYASYSENENEGAKANECN